MSKGAPASPQPPVYNCQAPGCKERSDTIACPRHLFMLPISVMNALTNAIATGEGGMYGQAMKAAMILWTEEPE
jgi:hypothetical protein